MERSEMEKNLEHLKSSLASGELTGSELVRRLQIMIQNEFSKPEKEVDIEFIEACSSLIERIYPKIAERPEGYYEEQEAKFKLRLMQEEKALRHRRVLRPVIAIAAVLIIAFLGIGSIQFHWFTRESTPDQQQLIIQGHEISVGMVEKAIADHRNSGKLETTNPQELDEYLGFSLGKLNVFPDEWKIKIIRTVCQDDSILTSIRYTNVNDPKVEFRYTIDLFLDIDDAIYSIQQHDNGYTAIIKGEQVTITKNSDYNVFVWMKNNAVHYISSTVSVETLMSITERLLGGTI